MFSLFFNEIKSYMYLYCLLITNQSKTAKNEWKPKIYQSYKKQKYHNFTNIGATESVKNNRISKSYIKQLQYHDQNLCAKSISTLNCFLQCHYT